MLARNEINNAIEPIISALLLLSTAAIHAPVVAAKTNLPGFNSLFNGRFTGWKVPEDDNGPGR
jgi:hypothetical protein